MTETHIQRFDNPQPRCPVALLLDTSSSMDGQPIEKLRIGACRFVESIIDDDFARFSVELCIVTFGGRAELKLPFKTFADGNTQPVDLVASGSTPMGHAIRIGLGELTKKKREYKQNGMPYYQPWMVLLTDGRPNDECWEDQAARARSMAMDGKLVFFGIGIGDEVDMETLASILPDNRPPRKLRGLKFAEFFQWLSQSMSRVSQSSINQRVAMPPTDGWEAV